MHVYKARATDNLLTILHPLTRYAYCLSSKNSKTNSATKKGSHFETIFVHFFIGDKYSAEESLASRGHFLACGDIQGKIENIHSYPKKVCPFFEIHHNFSGSSYTEKDFLSDFINKSVGISIEEMNTYVTLLAKIAQQGRAQSKCPEFKAILLSYDCRDSDDYKKQPFNDLCELKEIMDMAMNYVNDLTDGPRLM